MYIIMLIKLLYKLLMNLKFNHLKILAFLFNYLI